MRDFELERKLQASMDDGANIWVIGDVHGYFSTLQSLVEKLELNENDAVVMLGDLIDRGPSSADVVNYVKSTENIHSIRGNHEQMMIDSSYIAMFGCNEKACNRASEDIGWMMALPTEIVLDDWRLVHGGYDQNYDVEDESQEDIHMYARKQFFSSKHAIDSKRTILFGHSVTFKHLHKDDSKAGLIWLSDVQLDDGRPMAIGLDTCIYHEFDLPKILAAYNIQTEEVIYQNRI